MTGHPSLKFTGRVMLASLLMGSAVACAPSAAPSATEAPAPEASMRSNYIVSLSPEGAAPDTPERAAQMRAQLEADRERVLEAVFGAEAPAAGGSFVSAYAFEIRLTADEAARLARHSDVIQVEADQLSRPMGSGTAG